ncbi:transcription elongation factor [Sulfolobales archaeon HS-7]|nr:transcription elongation factor [Sulfolobales archaeon HS-7]
MGGRKKRKQKVVRPKPTVPKTFQCPRCGRLSISIKIKKGIAEIRCGSCKLKTAFAVPPVYKEVDAYGKFIDGYTEGSLEITEMREDEYEGESGEISRETEE